MQSTQMNPAHLDVRVSGRISPGRLLLRILWKAAAVQPQLCAKALHYTVDLQLYGISTIQQGLNTLFATLEPHDKMPIDGPLRDTYPENLFNIHNSDTAQIQPYADIQKTTTMASYRVFPDEDYIDALTVAQNPAEFDYTCRSARHACSAHVKSMALCKSHSHPLANHLDTHASDVLSSTKLLFKVLYKAVNSKILHSILRLQLYVINTVHQALDILLAFLERQRELCVTGHPEVLTSDTVVWPKVRFVSTIEMLAKID